MHPIIERKDNGLEGRYGGVTAFVPSLEIRFAHLGCKVLGTIPNLPPEIAVQWDERFGGRKAWAQKLDVQKRMVEAFRQTASAAHVEGFVLWDTMRRGSDYWRPGKGLTDVAEALRHDTPAYDVTYARVDALCPPLSLLDQFRKTELSFGSYAEAYAAHLRSGGVEHAVAAVLMALAQQRLAVFYCVDPYIPGYRNPADTLSDRPYEERWWLALREEGCHRVILAEEVARWFVERRLPVSVFAIDPTFARFYQRNYA